MLVALLMGLAIVVASTHGQLTFNQEYVNTPSNIKEARGPNRYEYTVNLLVGLNSSMSLSTLNQTRSILWALTQRLTNSSLTSIPLFHITNPAIRQDSFIRSTYKCAPNESDCNAITVSPIKLQSIGDYSYQSFMANMLDSLNVDYNVSTWVHPIDLQCGTAAITDNQTICAANKSQAVVSVLGANRVTVSCSILVAQNDQYDPKAELVIRSVEDNTECSDTESTQVRLIPPILAQPILNPLLGSSPSTVNTVLYRLTRNCTRIFTKASLNTRLTCQLQPRVDTPLPIELQPSSPYTALTMTLDVQYAPEYSAPPSQQFNRTMIVNSSAAATPVFTCPFESNPPPQFEWRVALVVINRTSDSAAPPRRRLDITEFLTAGKDYIIPRDLEVGLYGFECRAKTLGLVNKYSDTVKFYLSVIPVPVSSKKAILSGDKQNSFFKSSNTNVGAIIGGVIGGVLAIAVIVLLVLFLVRRHQRGLKDEPEKAKELDIGLNENNPHLSSRSNLSTAGLTAQTATTTSSSSASSTSSNTGVAAASIVAAANTPTASKSAVGIGHKAIAGLMVPSSTAQSYAAIAHAAAAAAAQQNRNQQQFATNQEANGSNPLYHQQQSLMKSGGAQSYNNPGFFESTTASYPIQPQSHLESPPPYDSALHHQQQQQQQSAAKKDAQQQQMMLQSQQKDYMGSNSRLLGGSGSNTPTLIQKNPSGSSGVLNGGVPQSHSYSHQLGGPSTPGSGGITGSLQQMQYPSNGSQNPLQYTTVQALQARNRQPLNGSGVSAPGGDMVDQAATQYTTMAQLNPIDV